MNRATTQDDGAPPLSEQTLVIAAFFQAQCGLDIDFAAARKAAEAQPPTRRGRPARGEEGVAVRRQEHPLAKLYEAVALVDVGYLPLCVAHSAGERDLLNREIAEILALPRARAAGVITGWVICWPKGPFPKTAASVRLLTAAGQSKARCLGAQSSQLAHWVSDYKAWQNSPFTKHGRIHRGGE